MIADIGGDMDEEKNKIAEQLLGKWYEQCENGAVLTVEERTLMKSMGKRRQLRMLLSRIRTVNRTGSCAQKIFPILLPHLYIIRLSIPSIAL